MRHSKRGGGGRGASGNNSQHARPWAAWVESYPAVSSWMARYGDLEHLVDTHGGLVKVRDFLPRHVAEGILSVLQRLPARVWNETSASRDYAHNNIEHRFLSVKSAPQLEAILRVFTLLLPNSLHTFSAAKYSSKDHIAPHDDRAYTQVMMEDGSICTCSRHIAVIYYLTKDWRAEEGGHLVDLEAPGGPKTYVPEFNSAVMFRIPRWHRVTPVTGCRPRYSVFGWFLQPGILYPLNTVGSTLEQSGDQVGANVPGSPGGSVGGSLGGNEFEVEERQLQAAAPHGCSQDRAAPPPAAGVSRPNPTQQQLMQAGGRNPLQEPRRGASKAQQRFYSDAGASSAPLQHADTTQHNPQHHHLHNSRLRPATRHSSSPAAAAAAGASKVGRRRGRQSAQLSLLSCRARHLALLVHSPLLKRVVAPAQGWDPCLLQQLLLEPGLVPT